VASKKRAKKSVAIPLAHRLPNPPAVYVGREADLAWLAEAVERAPVTLVTGPGGVGKTALVLEALHSRFARKVDRTLFIDISPGEPAGQIRQDILRALASVGGEKIDWPAMQAEPETVTATALDLAEAGGFYIVVDDVFQGDTDETAEMLVQLASYARKSRWIATSRSSPRRPELAGQVLTLAAMSDEELSALSAAWAPGADPATMRRAIAKASGSPWLLSQLLVTGSSEEALEERGLLAGLSVDAAAFLRGLTLVEIPLSLAVLTLFTPHPGDEALGVLEQRGLVTRSAGGVRLHDVARGLLSGGRRHEGGDEAHVAALLAQQESVDARLEAARLLGKLGRFDDLADLLDRDAEEFLNGGYGPRLWKILRNAADPAVESWKLRCAAELGNPTALAEVRAPAREGAAESLAWARTLRASGDPEDAAEQLTKMLRSESIDPAIRAEAMLLLATCTMHLGRYADADEILRATDARDPGFALARDAARALSMVLGGGDPPLDELAQLRQRALASEDDATGAFRDLAEAFLALGMIPEARELAERGRPRNAGAVLLSNRESILTSARALLEQGDLAGARRLADEVRAFARGSSLLLPALHHLDVKRRLGAGELDGLGPFLAACVREVEGIDARADIELSTLAIRLAVAHATPGRHSPPSNDALTKSRAGRVHQMWETLRAIRETGEATATTGFGEGDRRLEVLAALVDATRALAGGDMASATRHAVESVRLGVRFELALLEADGRALLCDALLCAGRPRDLAREAGHLASLGEGLGSQRLLLEASLAMAAARDARLSPALLERLAASEHVAPTAARRARALLGAEPQLDHVDLRILESLAGRAGPFESVSGRGVGDEWQPAWGIDVPGRAVWLSDGRSVEVAGQGLRILEVLSEHEEGADKETLVRKAWGQDEYHPLRDDGKLHVAVRKLREVIEDDAKNPVRLATTEDGYRLGGRVRRIPAA
jgi:hypothetical protein